MKRISIFLLLVICMFLCSCSPAEFRVWKLNQSTDDEMAEEVLSSVIDAINEQDREALKSLFSEQSLTDAEDFDDAIDSLFELIPEEIISWEKDDGPVVHDTNDHGHKTKYIISFYYLETDTQTYFIDIERYYIDTDHPENVGLYLLVAVNKENEFDIYDSEKKIFYDGDERLSPVGVVVPFL